MCRSEWRRSSRLTSWTPSSPARLSSCCPGETRFTMYPLQWISYVLFQRLTFKNLKEVTEQNILSAAERSQVRKHIWWCILANLWDWHFLQIWTPKIVFVNTEKRDGLLNDQRATASISRWENNKQGIFCPQERPGHNCFRWLDRQCIP